VLIRDIPTAAASAFYLHSIPEIENAGIDFYKDDVPHNFITRESQFMNGSIPWKESREKDPLLLQLLLEVGTKIGDIVIDCTTAISDLLPLSFLFFHSRLFVMQFLWLDCYVYEIL
jgi:hypothetical protein